MTLDDCRPKKSWEARDQPRKYWDFKPCSEYWHGAGAVSIGSGNEKAWNG